MKKKKTRQFNHMRCMTYKNYAMFVHRKRTRKAFLNLIESKSDNPPYMQPLDSYFGVNGDVLELIRKNAHVAANCMSAPYYKCCRNTLLCEECLAAWRYKLVKTLQRNCTDEKLYFLVRRTHDFIVPRGLVKGAYGRQDDLTYLLSDAFGTDGNWGLRLTHPLASFQQPAGNIFAVVNGVDSYGFSDKNYNDFYSIYRSAILPRGKRNRPKAEVLEGPVMCGNIGYHMDEEKTYLTNMIDSFGGAYRKSFRLIDDNSLLCMSFQSLILLCRSFNELGPGTQSRLTHGSKNLVTEYQTPVYPCSDIYVSHRITIAEQMYMSDEDIPVTLRFIESAFPYNRTIDNMTPFEYLLCYYALRRRGGHISSCTGLLREDGKKT